MRKVLMHSPGEMQAAAYSIEDLDQANAALDEVARRWTAAYSTNGPTPLDAEAKAAAAQVQEIKADLKRRGLLPATDHAFIEDAIDAAFPHAANREVVLHDGKRYRRRFYPLEKSSTGTTVKKWKKAWEPLDN